MRGLRFRRAARTDAAEFARLHALCFETSWDTESFSRLLGRAGAVGILAFAAREDRAAGLALCERVGEEAEILTMGVCPGHRGRGLASALLAHGCDTLALLGVSRLHLEVAADNFPALALYRTAGFCETGRRQGYYRRGKQAGPVDALLLSRHLPPKPRR